MPGGAHRDAGGGMVVEWHQPLRSEKSEHMAPTGVIWPQFLHRDGCQTKATCVTGFRGAQSTPGRSINTMHAMPHQLGGRGSLGSQLVMRVHTANMAVEHDTTTLPVA